jgi:hypothetical protein
MKQKVRVHVYLIEKVGENRKTGLFTFIFVHSAERSVCPISVALSPSSHQQFPGFLPAGAPAPNKKKTPISWTLTDGGVPPKYQTHHHHHAPRLHGSEESNPNTSSTAGPAASPPNTTPREDERMKRNSLAVPRADEPPPRMYVIPSSQIQDPSMGSFQKDPFSQKRLEKAGKKPRSTQLKNPQPRSDAVRA